MSYAPKDWKLPEPDEFELGNLIDVLGSYDPDLVLPLGFHKPHSYRMDYHQVAFEPTTDISIGDMLAAAKSAVGTVYEGWKGGMFAMDYDTEVYVAFTGDPGERIGRFHIYLMVLAATEKNRGQQIASLRGQAADL